MLSAQGVLVHHVFFLLRFQILYEPLGFSQQAQSCVPGRFVTQRNHFFQFFQTVSEMSSPVFLQFIMSCSASLRLLRLCPLRRPFEIDRDRHRRSISVFRFCKKYDGVYAVGDGGGGGGGNGSVGHDCGVGKRWRGIR